MLTHLVWTRPYGHFWLAVTHLVWLWTGISQNDCHQMTFITYLMRFDSFRVNRAEVLLFLPKLVLLSSLTMLNCVHVRLCLLFSDVFMSSVYEAMCLCFGYIVHVQVKKCWRKVQNPVVLYSGRCVIWMTWVLLHWYFSSEYVDVV